VDRTGKRERLPSRTVIWAAGVAASGLAARQGEQTGAERSTPRRDRPSALIDARGQAREGPPERGTTSEVIVGCRPRRRMSVADELQHSVRQPRRCSWHANSEPGESPISCAPRPAVAGSVCTRSRPPRWSTWDGADRRPRRASPSSGADRGSDPRARNRRLERRRTRPALPHRACLHRLGDDRARDRRREWLEHSTSKTSARARSARPIGASSSASPARSARCTSDVGRVSQSAGKPDGRRRLSQRGRRVGDDPARDSARTACRSWRRLSNTEATRPGSRDLDDRFTIRARPGASPGGR
jgi:hypothetical protein